MITGVKIMLTGRLVFSFHLPYTDDNTIGPDISIEYLSAGKGNDPVHFFCHFFYTEETEVLAGCHVVETCPHVFIPPSTIPAVVYINPYTFSHIVVPGFLSILNN
jgi:hypothetical protein